ncbi:MAG: 50S ribosomal protein L24 [Candidatus Brocadiales bacterium]
MHVVKNDLVEVLAGDDLGKTGKVLFVAPKKGRVIVEGINYIWKHVRPSPRNPQGGRIQKESPIAISKVLVVCPNKNCKKYGKGVQTRNKLGESGTRIRVCAKCGSAITASAEK